ncbi:hypothetical protein MACJ_001894 [Theileria orientalis]|uniref:Uncharacterized protein n=1 Tax=Theileria orientalis TaxID=68886 RepID=A0A976M572_THEOR|nr:hypothetical protein MACJ_001894 [Theileria orientalis]
MEGDGTENHNQYHNNMISCLVCVHPSQYERILKRREERSRLMERRGRARPVHIPIVPLDYPQNYIQYQNNGMLCDQYGNPIDTNLWNNHVMQNNGCVDGYANDPRTANVSGAKMNATNYAQANYRNQVNRNIMYNRYYGYRYCNGYPIVGNRYVTVRGTGPYDHVPNVNTQARSTNAMVSNMCTDNVNKNSTACEELEVDSQPQRDTIVKSDHVPTQNQEAVNNQYYTVVAHTPEAMEMDLGMESNTTEAMESGTESNSSGTMEPGMRPIKTESMSTYMAPEGTEVIDQNMVPNAIENMDPNLLGYMAANAAGMMGPYHQLSSPGGITTYVNPNMIPAMVQNTMPPMVPNTVPNMPNAAAGLTPRMGPGVPNVFATMGYKMASDVFASIASTLTSDMDPNGRTKEMPNVEPKVQPNAELREITNVSTMTENRKLNNKSKTETMDPQSAANAIGGIDPNTVPGTSETIDTRMMPNTMENIESNKPTQEGPNAMEAMRAYLGPDSASNLAKYMVKNMVTCPYRTVDNAHSLKMNVRSHPYTSDVRQKPCTTNAIENERAATNENDEVQPAEEAPRERRRKPKVNRRAVIRELCRVLTRGRSINQSTNRRTNRSANRNTRSNDNPSTRCTDNRRVRREDNRSNSSSTRAYTDCFDNRSNAEDVNGSSQLQGCRKELELLLKPELATALDEQVPSKRTIVDIYGNGLVKEGNYDFNSMTVKRQCVDVTTRSTMSTMAENADEYNFVAACAILNETTARKNRTITDKAVEIRAVSPQYPAINNVVNCGGQNDTYQLVGNYPFHDYRASHEIYPAFHYVPNNMEEVIHDYLYGLYMMQMALLQDELPYGHCVTAANFPSGNFASQNATSSEGPSSENNTNTDNHSSTENNSNTENYSSTENNTNIESYSSIENITNTSNNTSIDNDSNTSNNTSIENSTEVDNNTTNWNNINAGNNAQDYYYANAGNNEVGFYQQYPSNTAEDYYYEHAWNVANINYETACAYVASHCNLDKPNSRKPRRTGSKNDQKKIGRKSIKKGQNSGASKTNANKSKDNQNDHQVNGGESLARTTQSETAQLYRQLYDCFDEDKNHQ